MYRQLQRVAVRDEPRDEEKPPPPSDQQKGSSVTDDKSPAPKPPRPTGPRNDAFYRSWDRFYSKPRAPRIIVPKPLDVDAEGEATHDTDQNSQGQIVRQKASKSYEEAAKSCKSKVEAIVKECRYLNRKYRDVTFELGLPSSLESLNAVRIPPRSMHILLGVNSVQRVDQIFDNPKFIVDGATANDVRQGTGSDCWFLAGISSLAGTPELLQRLLVAQDEQSGVYGFVFYRDGEWISIVVDDRLALKDGDDIDKFLLLAPQGETPHDTKWEKLAVKSLDKKYRESLKRGSDALFFASCKESDETWLPLLEKAYAKAHGDYQAIEGGFPGEAIEDLTGGVCSILDSESILDKEKFWQQLLEVNKSFLFGCATRPNAATTENETNIVAGHAYTVLEAREVDGEKLLKLRNPWGHSEWKGDWSDGSKQWTAERMMALKHTFGDDGVFWIALKDFLKHYPVIDRTRLFGPEWTVSQQWTSVTIPLHPRYNSTHFTFTVTNPGSVVIVLSQPDRRYFRGLEGRYNHQLHFRVYKQGEKRYLFRSLNDTGSQRSCNVEAELEVGTYEVHFKIDTYRISEAATVEEMIRQWRDSRKEKLIDAGRRFDQIASKGLLREHENSIRLDEKQKDREELIEDLKANRRVRAMHRERSKRRTQRLKDKRQEKIEQKMSKKREKLEQAAKNRAAELPVREHASVAFDHAQTALRRPSRTDTGNEPMGRRTPPLSQTDGLVSAVTDEPHPFSASSQTQPLPIRTNTNPSEPTPLQSSDHNPFNDQDRERGRNGAPRASDALINEADFVDSHFGGYGPPTRQTTMLRRSSDDGGPARHEAYCWAQREGLQHGSASAAGGGGGGADEEHVCVSDVSSVFSVDLAWDSEVDAPIEVSEADERRLLGRGPGQARGRRRQRRRRRDSRQPLSPERRGGAAGGGGGGGGGASRGPDGDGGSESDSEGELGDDPWNANLVLGLRVYAVGEPVVIEAKKGPAEGVEQGDEEIEYEGEEAFKNL